MISFLTQVIQEHPEWLRSPGTSLSFMKFSTPASGKGVGVGADKGKVLLFVFENRELLPTLCVKTTRTYSAGDVIRRNHQNLKTLQEGVHGSEYAQMFTMPLYLHDEGGPDDGDLVFSIESVVPGVMFSAEPRGVEPVVERYGAWQSYLAQKALEVLHKEDIENLAYDLINTLGLSEVSTNLLKNFFQKLPLDLNVKLPVLIQHGDMTPDNVLVSGRNVYLIDYDYVGVSQLPGFDLFHFLSKSKFGTRSFRSNCEKYFPPYFQSIGAKIELYDSLFFIYYLQEIRRKKYIEDGERGDGILANFKALMDRQ